MIFSTECLPPLLDLFRLYLSEYGCWFPNLMTRIDQFRNPLRVSLDPGEQLLVSLGPLALLVQQAHLLVDLR